MPRRDAYHDAVKNALIKDGWTITHDPLTLPFGSHKLFVDLGAERLLAAERGSERIAVEVKTFAGPSEVTDMEQALGQYLLYRSVLSRSDPIAVSSSPCPRRRSTPSSRPSSARRSAKTTLSRS